MSRFVPELSDRSCCCCYRPGTVLLNGRNVCDTDEEVDAFVIAAALNRLTDAEHAAILAEAKVKVTSERDRQADWTMFCEAQDLREKVVHLARVYIAAQFGGFNTDAPYPPSHMDTAEYDAWWKTLNDDQRMSLTW